uniref:Retrograde transport protein Dsl1 C-terminal domain-containing protein n=1 Tax=Candidozyma auris TaxID=498019 RepID=A0A0L0P1A8_CANAR
MLAQRLEENKRQLSEINDRIEQFAKNLQPSNLIINDVSEFHNKTLYQLDNEHQQTTLAAQQLQQLWILKNLIHETQLLFDPLNEGNYVCDSVELEGILQNIKNLKLKIAPFLKDNYIIGSNLQESYEKIIESYRHQLGVLFTRHIQQELASVRISTSLTINEQTHLLKDFLRIVSDFEVFSGENVVTETLNRFKQLWDKFLLDPLVNKKNYLLLYSESENETVIELADALPASQFLSKYYFDSVRNFTAFINLLENQSFKNYYLTKINNNIVNMISENIEQFMSNRELLSQELVNTVQGALKTGWNMQISRSLGSVDQIDSSINRLHLDWVTSKYIDKVRNYFNSSKFAKDLKDCQNIEIERQEAAFQPPPLPPPPPPAQSEPQPSAQSVLEPEQDDEVDWDQPWGSDEEQAAGDDDGWDRDWDDDWDDDDDDAVKKSPIKPKQQAQLKPASIPQTAPSTQVAPPPQATYTDVVTTSSVIGAVKQIVSDFVSETGQENLDELLFAVCEFALTSYRPLHELLLLYNDLQALGYDETITFAEAQWKHAQIQLRGQISLFLSSIDFTNNGGSSGSTEESVGITAAISNFNNSLTQLVESDMANTNKGLLKSTIVGLCNYANTWVLDGILSSTELTEFQCEKFTLVLESLGEVEANVLRRLGSESNRLATYNKTKQAILLLNNHLNDIMEHFYQGDFFDFSTEELIQVLKSVFIASDLRENCIQEIFEVRSS